MNTNLVVLIHLFDNTCLHARRQAQVNEADIQARVNKQKMLPSRRNTYTAAAKPTLIQQQVCKRCHAQKGMIAE
jgi:hypothetical protein